MTFLRNIGLFLLALYQSHFAAHDRQKGNLQGEAKMGRYYHCLSSMLKPSGSLISARLEGPRLTGAIDISTPLLLR